MKFKIIKIASGINLILWITFIWLDNIWNDVLKEAVTRKDGVYGELFGPVSYFRPKILFLAILFTIIVVIMIFRLKNEEKVKCTPDK